MMVLYRPSDTSPAVPPSVATTAWASTVPNLEVKYAGTWRSIDAYDEMPTAIASTTACVRYRWTRKCLPLNVAIVVNQPAGAAGSPENGGQGNRPPPSPSTRLDSTRNRANASSPGAADLNCGLRLPRFLAFERTKVPTVRTDRRRFESKLRRSFTAGTTLDRRPTLPKFDPRPYGPPRT